MQRIQLRQFSRFKLRTFLFVITAFALFMAYENHLESVRRSVVSEIESHKGTVVYGKATWLDIFPTRRIEEVSIPDQNFRNFDATTLDAFPRLTKLELLDVKLETKSGLRFRLDKLVYDRAKLGDFVEKFKERKKNRIISDQQ